MPEWEDIFEEQGRVFTEPHQDMEWVVQVFQEYQASLDPSPYLIELLGREPIGGGF